MPEVTGGCMCGNVRYTVEIENDDAYLCHCRMCQRSSGNISLSMKQVKRANVRWEREPDYYQSSPFARRGFCASCGTSLTFEFTDGRKSTRLNSSHTVISYAVFCLKKKS